MLMLIARIVFKPGSASYFCEGAHQGVVEMRFESVEALIGILREIEDDIQDCTAIINGTVVDLRSVSEQRASA